MFSSTGYSLSDIAAATGERSGDGMWNNGAWWIIILFLFVFCGWGGGFRNNGVPMQDGNCLTKSDLCSEFNFNNLTNSVRGVQQGLCDGFYSQNNAISNGFAGVQYAMNNGFAGVDNAICQLGYNMQSGFNQNNVAMTQAQSAIQAQLADCCCRTQNGFKDVEYAMATDTCSIENTIQNVGRDIIENANNNARMLYDFAVQSKIDAKDEKIACLTAKNQELNTAALVSNQTTYLVNTLNPQARPAYIVANPNGCISPYYNGYNNGCGCSCGSF